MIDRPDAATLLEAMAATLSNEVLPSTSGATRHAVRVVANLCLILEREVRAGPHAREESRHALAGLLEREGSLEELVEALDQRLRADDFEGDEAVREVLLADVGRRLAIDRPGYDS